MFDLSNIGRRSITSKRIPVILAFSISIMQTSIFLQYATANEPLPNKHSISLTTTGSLSSEVKHGLAYLVDQQQGNGGWSQGEESAFMGRTSKNITDLPNVGDTCMAA